MKKINKIQYGKKSSRKPTGINFRHLNLKRYSIKNVKKNNDNNTKCMLCLLLSIVVLSVLHILT